MNSSWPVVMSPSVIKGSCPAPATSPAMAKKEPPHTVQVHQTLILLIWWGICSPKVSSSKAREQQAPLSAGPRVPAIPSTVLVVPQRCQGTASPWPSPRIPASSLHLLHKQSMWGSPGYCITTYLHSSPGFLGFFLHKAIIKMTKVAQPQACALRKHTDRQAHQVVLSGNNLEK